MTLTLLTIDNQIQIIVSPIFNNITEEFKVIIESATDEQISTFTCTPGSSHYSFIQPLFKKIAMSCYHEPGREFPDDNHLS